jgi:transcriptional regulator with GAF, ATPase, and Fis domain
VNILRQLRVVANGHATVLVSGEMGTVNCGAVPDTLLEAELFIQP